MALLIIGDYLFVGFTPIFFALVALRIALIVYSLLQIRYLSHVKDYKAYDKSIFIYMLVVTIGVLFINFSRPENFIIHIIIVDMLVLVFYLVMPTRFIYQALPSWIFSAGEIILIMATFQGSMELGLDTALLSMLFANIVAALTSLEMHAYRWRMFKMTNERKETDRLAAIGQTAGMIGHDIRNPLQAITTELYLAKQSIDESPMPPEIKNPALESLNLVEEQTDYISKIVSDLQDYARPLKPEIKKVELAKLVTSVFQTVRIPNRITLKVDIHGFPTIQTDPTLIRRALTNLVNNGIQAMPDGGVLELIAHKTGQEAILTVSDTGMGIPDEIKPRLFTPLVTSKAKGQGLGLAVVKRLVEALGGSITFESEAGKGTIFTVTLPVND